MASEDTEIKFICSNYHEYSEGKLELPHSFFMKYESTLPKDLFLHVGSSLLWDGRFDKGSRSIVGLKDMMVYHKIRSYHVLVLTYMGRCLFRVEIFNPYGVEINYVSDAQTDGASVDDLIMSNDEIRRTFASFCYNVCHNFTGIVDLVVDANHLVENSEVQVLSMMDCQKLNLSTAIDCLKIGYHSTQWTIKMKWLENEVLFDNGWFEFVKANNLVPGDVVVLIETSTVNRLKLCIIPGSLLHVSVSKEGSVEKMIVPKFLKLTNTISLRSGQLEIPFVFAEKYGNCFESTVEVLINGEKSYSFKYSAKERRLYNLDIFFVEYKILQNYFLIFEYVGAKKFEMTVYDGTLMLLKRQESGTSKLQNFNPTTSANQLITLSDSSSERVKEFSIEEQAPSNSNKATSGFSTQSIQIMDVDSDSSSDMSSDTTSSSSDDEEVVVNDHIHPSFHITLKDSHVDGRGHGAYIPNVLSAVYSSWGKRTSVLLSYNDLEWNAEVIHSPTYCRFAIGWDEFMFENKFVVGDELIFQYVGDLTFEVTKTR